MKTLTAMLAGIVSLALVAGCGSTPPSNYYLLSADVRTTGLDQSPAIGIGPVDIPEYLNRNSMVYSKTGNQLHIESAERWAEPLKDGIRRVVGLNLAAELGTQNLQSFPWSPGQTPDYGVTLRVLALDASRDSAEALVEWELRHPANGATLTRRMSRLQTGLPGGELSPAALPPAYSELFRQLSAEMAGAIRADLESAE